MSTENITVVIPAAPMPTNPNTKILDITLESIRKQLPESAIIVTFDAPQDSATEIQKMNYIDFIKNFLHKHAAYIAGNPGMLEFYAYHEHQHQTGTFKNLLERDRIKTEFICYVEQDTPFSDREIPWEAMMKTIHEGTADTIRLPHTTEIPKEHYHMYFDKPDQPAPIINGIPLLKLYEWSQRPHLSTLEFYRKMFKDYVGENEKAYIEHKWYGPIASEGSTNGWGKFKIMMYHPEGNIERSWHLDGRKRLVLP